MNWSLWFLVIFSFVAYVTCERMGVCYLPDYRNCRLYHKYIDGNVLPEKSRSLFCEPGYSYSALQQVFSKIIYKRICSKCTYNALLQKCVEAKLSKCKKCEADKAGEPQPDGTFTCVKSTALHIVPRHCPHPPPKN